MILPLAYLCLKDETLENGDVVTVSQNHYVQEGALAHPGRRDQEHVVVDPSCL